MNNETQTTQNKPAPIEDLERSRLMDIIDKLAGKYFLNIL